jgi:probable F420-dependent oxidoreductase
VFDSPYPYGGAKSAQLPVSTDYPDPLVAIAALAGATSTIRFMTAVLVAPLRHPLALAKAVATAATMSSNRLDLGVGVGWLREEYDALGVPYFAERGAVLDEMLPLLPRLWSGDLVEHRGKFFAWGPVAVNPAPSQPIPVFIGGHSDAAIRRCAQAGDGWVGVNPTVDELTQIVTRLREARAEAGTESKPFEIRTGIKGALTEDRLEAVTALGIDALLVAPWQIGERRESVFDQTAAAIRDALPPLVKSVLGG